MKKAIALAALGIGFMSIHCSQYVEQYPILEYLPYNNYGNYFTAEPIDTLPAFAISGGVSNTRVSADNGADISGTGPFGSLRISAADWVEIGVTASAREIGEDLSPYFLLDGRGEFLRDPVLLGVDLGFGMGPGERNLMYDLRGSLVCGVPLLDGRINPYVAPRVILLSYPWQRIYDELSWRTSYALAVIAGASLGVSFSQPIGSYVMKFVPEATWTAGREPRLDRVDFTNLQIGAKLMLVFPSRHSSSPEVRIRPCLF